MDRHLWPPASEDPHAPTLHVTADGRIGINVGGVVIVKELCAWHSLAAGPMARRIAELEAALKPFADAARADEKSTSLGRIRTDDKKVGFLINAGALRAVAKLLK